MTQQPGAFAHTFSIVARDPASGQMGAAVQSHWFSVGSVVAWAQPGLGAVVTQSMVEVSYGPLGLERLAAGQHPRQALDELLALDEGRELRQVALLDARGQVAVHTGARCVAAAGHISGEGFSVQANMMLNDGVWPAMAAAYRAAQASGQGDLADWMMAALDAAQAAGGDLRGRQSACLKVVRGQTPAKPWQGVLVDLRVEDASDPLAELRRLLHLQRAYEHMNTGDALLGAGEIEQALQAYRAAAQMAPHVAELPFWQAVTLADLGRLEEALPIFAQVFAAEPQWAEMLRRLPPAGLLRDDPEMLSKILAVCP